MKQLITLIVAFTLTANSFSQSRTETIEYLKVKRQAVVTEIPFAEKVILKSIDDKMEKLGYKGKDTKGYTIYKSVKMPELGSEFYDLYFTAERKSRKDKDNSSLTMLISKGYDNFVADSNDAPLMENAKNYLNGFTEMVAAYDLELQIKDQEDAVAKADKKYNSLIDDGQELEKKRKKIEQDIEDNKKNQTNQQTETEKQKQILENLREKRKQ